MQISGFQDAQWFVNVLWHPIVIPMSLVASHSVPRDGIKSFYKFLGRINMFPFLKSRDHFWIGAKKMHNFFLFFYDFIGP